MDEDLHVRGAPFFANGGGNPISLNGALRRIWRLEEHNVATEASPIYVYYLDQISNEMLKSHNHSLGPSPLKQLPWYLFQESNNNTDIPDEKYDFYLFYLLVKFHGEINDYEGMEKLVERFEEEFEDEPYFGKLKTISLLKTEEPRFSEAIELACRYASDFPDYKELRKILAEAIVLGLEEGVVYNGSTLGIPTDRDELIALAEKSIREAMSAERYPAEYTAIRARVLVLNGDFEAASDSISEAISDLSRRRYDYNNTKTEFGLIQNRIIVQEQQKELDERTEDISSSLTKLETDVNSASNKIKSLSTQVDDIRQEFQRTILEFLGFFSAIIAVVVITGQIALSISNPRDAGRLMLISYGGLLFAFGGFAIVLGRGWKERLLRLVLSLVGLGTAVLVLNHAKW